MLASRFVRIKSNSNHKGILQKYFVNDRSFATLKGSSTLSTASDETSVINTKNYWESVDEQFPNFTIELSKNIIKMSGFAFHSCASNDCVSQLDILGSNEGSNWDLICKVNESKYYYQGKIQNTQCKSMFSYRFIRFMHSGLNIFDHYHFPIWYLDLYGDLYPLSADAITILRCRNSKVSHCAMIAVLLSW